MFILKVKLILSADKINRILGESVIFLLNYQQENTKLIFEKHFIKLEKGYKFHK